MTFDCTLLPRKRITVKEVIVHDDYRTENQTDDIALLKLSEYLSDIIYCQVVSSEFSRIPLSSKCPPVPSLLPPGERVDLFTYPPVCLPGQEQDFVGKEASVYGEEDTFYESAFLSWSLKCVSTQAGVLLVQWPPTLSSRPRSADWRGPYLSPVSPGAHRQ